MMANVPACALAPTTTPGVAQGNVCLLLVDSISDLHSIPLDTEIPQGEEVISDAVWEKSMVALPDKPEAPSTDHSVSHSRCGSPCTNAILTFLIVIAFVNMSLLLYILHLYSTQGTVLRTLTEKLHAQMDSLHKPSMNHEFKGNQTK